MFRFSSSAHNEHDLRAGFCAILCHHPPGPASDAGQAYSKQRNLFRINTRSGTESLPLRQLTHRSALNYSYCTEPLGFSIHNLFDLWRCCRRFLDRPVRRSSRLLLFQFLEAIHMHPRFFRFAQTTQRQAQVVLHLRIVGINRRRTL